MSTKVARFLDGKTKVNCWKCSGRGVLSWAMHVDNGRCWGCGGSGWVDVGKALKVPSKYEEWVIPNADGMVWHFYSIHDETSHYGDRTCMRIPKGSKERVDSVMVQVFKSGSNLRKDRSVFRARLEPDLGRELFRAAKRGEDPEAAANRLLSHLFGTCAFDWKCEISPF